MKETAWPKRYRFFLLHCRLSAAGGPGTFRRKRGDGALTPSRPADNFHRESPSGRARSCQKATALAAATFRESTPWAMGIRTV